MSDVVYRSNVRIERVKGPVRKAFLPAESQPVIFGVHGAVAEHYKVPPNVLEPHATPLRRSAIRSERMAKPSRLLENLHIRLATARLAFFRPQCRSNAK